MENSLKRLTLLKSHISANKVADDEGKMHVEIREKDRVAILTWDFPMILNALGPETLTPLIEALNKFESDDGIGCVILTGAGNAF